MAQQVTVTSDTAVELRPLVESAIRTELHMLELELNRIRRILVEYELQYGISSEEFDRTLAAEDIRKKAEFIEWAAEIKTCRRLEGQRLTLKKAQIIT